jgi:hypothetical protein
VIRRVCLVWLACLVLSGCATLAETEYPGSRAIGPGEAPALRPDEVVIFGRILFIENGAHKFPYGLGKPLWQLTSPPHKAVGGQPTGKRRIIPFLSTRKDGVFVYAIPAGRYEIGDIVPFYYTPMIVPALEFSADQPGKAYYLGDLELDIDATSWLGGLWGNYITHLNYLEVVDRFDELGAQMASAFVADEPPKKSLLARIRGRIPALMDQGGAAILVSPSGLGARR